MKLDKILDEIANEIPGVISMGIVGAEGLGLAHYQPNFQFDIETTDAQFSLIMKLVQKTIAALGETEVEDNLVTTENTYILTHVLGDKLCWFWIVASKQSANLGNIRLVARNYVADLWKAIPGCK